MYLQEFCKRNIRAFNIKPGGAPAPTASTAGNRAPHGEGTPGQPTDANAPPGSGQTNSSTGFNISRTAVQSQPIMFSTSGSVPIGTGNQQFQDPRSVPPLIAEINSQIRSLILNAQGENRAPSGMNNSKNIIVT